MINIKIETKADLQHPYKPIKTLILFPNTLHYQTLISLTLSTSKPNPNFPNLVHELIGFRHCPASAGFDAQYIPYYWLLDQQLRHSLQLFGLWNFPRQLLKHIVQTHQTIRSTPQLINPHFSPVLLLKYVYRCHGDYQCIPLLKCINCNRKI